MTSGVLVLRMLMRTPIQTVLGTSKWRLDFIKLWVCLGAMPGVEDS